MTRLTASLVLAISFAVAASAADQKPKDLILGKWESQDGLSKGVIVEFKDDGTTVGSFKGRVRTTGKYKFVEDDVIEFESALAGGKKLVSRYRVKVTDDELTQTDLKTKTEKHFKRVK